jgi:hypothetical protein
MVTQDQSDDVPAIFVSDDVPAILVSDDGNNEYQQQGSDNQLDSAPPSPTNDNFNLMSDGARSDGLGGGGGRSGGGFPLGLDRNTSPVMSSMRMAPSINGFSAPMQQRLQASSMMSMLASSAAVDQKAVMNIQPMQRKQKVRCLLFDLLNRLIELSFPLTC